MEQEDRLRLVREVVAIKEGRATVSGDDPGPSDPAYMDIAVTALLAAMEERHPELRQWIDQAVRLAERRAALLLAQNTAEVTDAVRDYLAQAMSAERRRLHEAPLPDREPSAQLLQAYVVLATTASVTTESWT